MILNLAINARDAMPNGGTLTIETRNLDQRPADVEELSAGSYVCIAVRDTGTGMLPEILARAFDPFFTTKPPGKGTGLGLSQVYGFARQSGGTVRIESEASVGTVVRIFLPRSDVPPVAVSSGSPKKDLPLQAGTILVVDDDPDVLQSAHGILEGLGFRVIAASNARAALASLDRDKIDVALIDLIMPETSGAELAVRIRQAHPHVTLLFCSGYPDQVASQSGLITASNFISKPYQASELAALINALMKSRTHASAPDWAATSQP
jgi:CheY-like chemotaxis protein